MCTPHIKPNRDDIANNASIEVEGERIRKELEAFLTKNKISSIFLDTDTHCVNIQERRLSPEIKSVLTKWGSIYEIKRRNF